MNDTTARLSFRALGRPDFALLSRWLAAPHVHPWWREDADIDAIETRYVPAVDGRDRTECFFVELDGRPVGFVQRYLLADNPDWRTSLAVAGTPTDGAGIDYFIGVESLIGSGLGPEL